MLRRRVVLLLPGIAVLLPGFAVLRLGLLRRIVLRPEVTAAELT